MASTIFYAWQSDLAGKINRNFVEEALNKAITSANKHLAVEAAERLEIDKDTKGLPGAPAIADAILKKIDACTIFLADVTPVVATNDGKLIPNPNVMLELGYAVKSLDWDRIIMVMNTAFGTPDKLPFDLRHRRWPIQYMFSDESDDKRPQQDVLVAQLQRAIKAIVDTVMVVGNEKAAAQAKDEEQRAIHIRRTFEERVAGGAFNGFKTQVGVISVSLIPAGGLPVNFSDDAIRRTELRTMYSKNVPTYRHRAKALVALLAEDSPRGPLQATEVNQDGVFCADAVAIGDRNVTELRRTINNDIAGAVPGRGFEFQIIHPVHRYLEMLRRWDCADVIHIGIGLIHIHNFILESDAIGFELRHPHFEIRLFPDQHAQPELLMVNNSPVLSDVLVVASALRPAFDQIWQDFGYQRSRNYDQTGRYINPL